MSDVETDSVEQAVADLFLASTVGRSHPSDSYDCGFQLETFRAIHPGVIRAVPAYKVLVGRGRALRGRPDGLHNASFETETIEENFQRFEICTAGISCPVEGAE
eukprot:s1141_g4.t1